MPSGPASSTTMARRSSSNELLSQRDKINLWLQEIIDRQTDPWGIKVTAVEVRDVVLPDSMKRAMAGQATGSRPVVPNIEGLRDVPYLTSDLLTNGRLAEF